MRATDRCLEPHIGRSVDRLLMRYLQVGDAVTVTSAKHVCDVCAAESVSPAVVRRSQRT
jgi:hypothetical protein